MISPKEALDIVENQSIALAPFRINLSEALGYRLAQNVLSPIAMPPFRQSAMDGYAVNLHQSDSFTVIGEIQAGDGQNPGLDKNQGVRIFTGAAVPDDAQLVIMQEKIRREGEIAFIEGELGHHNIRPAGEQIQQGDIALEKGSFLNAAAIGFLTTLGITEVSVYRKPSVAIVSTGNELQSPGTPLAPGKIYESNSLMLQMALRSMGYANSSLQQIQDDYTTTVAVLKELIVQNDMVLISGGISVGDYDYVGKALTEIGVTPQFYKVKQKPGKPLFFGKKDNTLIFALPGNPAAALSCTYIYVRTALEKVSGNSSFQIPRTQGKISAAYTKKGPRAQFLKGYYTQGQVQVLEGQSSAMLRSFAQANVLVFIPEDRFEIAPGETVELIPIPGL
jgi:molybdopterin molybdotransferase